MAPGARPIRQERDDDEPSGRPLSTGPARMTPLRELQLLEKHRKGGVKAADALNELMRAYQRRIYSVCFRMVRNTDVASDLTQDALIKVIEGLASYNGQSKFSTWVIRVTINCCLSHMRKEKLRAHESLDAPAGMARQSPPQGGRTGSVSKKPTGEALSGILHSREPSPLRRIEQEQTNSAIVRCLDSLDVDLKTILVLRDLQDLDYQEMANVLEIPIGTVKSRLFRARAALRQLLEARGEL